MEQRTEPWYRCCELLAKNGPLVHCSWNTAITAPTKEHNSFRRIKSAKIPPAYRVGPEVATPPAVAALKLVDDENYIVAEWISPPNYAALLLALRLLLHLFLGNEICLFIWILSALHFGVDCYDGDSHLAVVLTSWGEFAEGGSKPFKRLLLYNWVMFKWGSSVILSNLIWLAK